jgi:hypothetical protein
LKVLKVLKVLKTRTSLRASFLLLSVLLHYR